MGSSIQDLLLSLVACLLAGAGLDGSSGLGYAHPTDYLTPHVHAGMESLIVARALLIREAFPPTLFRFGCWLDLACP